MKLHLGCGTKPILGWTNVDILPGRGEIQDDITTLELVDDSTADIIYASHVLEHTGRHAWCNTLNLWVRKLKPGGIIRIAVPNFSAAVEWYSRTGDINSVMGLVTGGQRDIHDYHNVIFDKHLLTKGLLDAGCESVREWDWRTTDHADHDDYSQSYLPHMDKEGGNANVAKLGR